MPCSHMALNQGVEDQLLFDPSKSYFVDPGYTRTSNFQMEVVDVESVNSASPGQTVQFLLPPSGDVLGHLDLTFQFNDATQATDSNAAWVESVGFALIDYVEFTVGSTVLERLTGDQMYIMNELLPPHERTMTQAGTTGTSATLTTGVNNVAVPWHVAAPSVNEAYPGSNDKWNRMIAYGNVIKPQTKTYHVPLPFHFTLNPGKFFPMSAVHGINDVRVTMRLRSLEEIILIKPRLSLSSTGSGSGSLNPDIVSGRYVRFNAPEPMKIFRVTILTDGLAAQLPTIGNQFNVTGAANVLLTSKVTNGGRETPPFTGGTFWTDAGQFAESISTSALTYFEIDLGETIGITKVTVRGLHGQNKYLSFSILDANRNAIYTSANEFMMDPALNFSDSPNGPIDFESGDWGFYGEDEPVPDPVLSASVTASAAAAPVVQMPKFASGVFKHFRLRAQYYCLAGPESSALAAKEQVRLYHDWQHLRELKTIKCRKFGQMNKVDIDLNFLHPVKEIIMVVRRASELTNDVTTNIGKDNGHLALNLGPASKNRFAFHGDPNLWDPNIDGLRNSHVGNHVQGAYAVHADITNFRLKLNGSERHTNISEGLAREYLHDQIVARQRPHTYGAKSHIARTKHAVHIAQHQAGGKPTENMLDRMLVQMDHALDSKSIFIYPLCIDGESHNPSGSVNFSKVSHGKFSFDMTGFTGNDTESADVEFYIDIYGVSYNWQQIRDGRALVSFA